MMQPVITALKMYPQNPHRQPRETETPQLNSVFRRSGGTRCGSQRGGGGGNEGRRGLGSRFSGQGARSSRMFPSERQRNESQLIPRRSSAALVWQSRSSCHRSLRTETSAARRPPALGPIPPSAPRPSPPPPRQAAARPASPGSRRPRAPPRPSSRRCGGSGRPGPPRGPDWRRRAAPPPLIPSLPPGAALEARAAERRGRAGQCHEPRVREAGRAGQGRAAPLRLAPHGAVLRSAAPGSGAAALGVRARARRGAGTERGVEGASGGGGRLGLGQGGAGPGPKRRGGGAPRGSPGSGRAGLRPVPAGEPCWRCGPTRRYPCRCWARVGGAQLDEAGGALCRGRRRSGSDAFKSRRHSRL